MAVAIIDPRLTALLEKTGCGNPEAVTAAKEAVQALLRYTGFPMLSLAVFNNLKRNDANAPLLRNVPADEELDEWEKLLEAVNTANPTVTILGTPEVSALVSRLRELARRRKSLSRRSHESEARDRIDRL